MISLKKAIQSQLKIMACAKRSSVVLGIIFLLILANFFSQVIRHQGSDLTDMYFPMKMTLLAAGSGRLGHFFLLIYPILVVAAAGSTFLRDREIKGMIQLHGRLGSRSYIYGKLGASFILTTLLFLIPFAVEMILYVISFPVNATGDLSNLSNYNAAYQQAVDRYFFSALFKQNPMLYSGIMILLFAVASGILATFVVAVSIIIRIKYKGLVFMVAYVLLYGLGMLGQVTGSRISLSYLNYLQLFDDSVKSFWYFGLLLVLTAFIFTAGEIGSRRDWLS